MNQPVDSSILHEIVRIIDSRRKVPDKVIVASKEYLLTYLEDHRHRLEEALMRFDADRLNMLYGQLASKVKYQLLRRVPARAAAAMGLTAAKAAAIKQAAKPAAKSPAVAPKPASKAAAPRAAKPVAAKAVPPKKKVAKVAVKKAAVAKKKPAAPKKVQAAPRRAAARPKKKARR